MNNALKKTLTSSYLKVDAMALEGGKSFSLVGSQITPRGVCVSCKENEITALHGSDSFESQPKFPVLLLAVELGFSDGEVVQLESQAQIQSIRRVSQQEFEVYMSFNNMVQDGYRHISRYVVDSNNSTE